MNKAIAGLASLAASCLLEPVTVFAQESDAYDKTAPSLQETEGSEEWKQTAKERGGIESKLLGCFVPSDQNIFFEKNYKRFSPKITRKQGLKDAYCLFTEALLWYHDKDMIRDAIAKMIHIGADSVDPITGHMYIELGFVVRKDYFDERRSMRNWVEIYAAAASPEEAVEKLNERNKRMGALEQVFDEAAGYLKKGVGIIVERGMHDEGLRNAAVAACKAIDFHARHNYDWEEVRKYEAIRRTLEK